MNPLFKSIFCPLSKQTNKTYPHLFGTANPMGGALSFTAITPPYHKFKLLIYLLLMVLLPGCYTIKNKNDERRINLQMFKNNTTIFGLENELSQFLPSAFRKETGFRTGNTNQGYIVRGQIIDYKKKVIRKTTNGDPTHQQVTIEVLIEFLENDKVLNTQKITNTSYRITSGLYNSTVGESESFGRQSALMDISEAIAQSVNYYFLEN